MPSSLDTRWDALETAGFNTALILSDLVPVDLSSDLPDAVSSRGLATVQDAHDELGESIKEVFGLDCWTPVHLGRGAEAAIASTVRPGECVLANEVYVTGAWSIQRFGGRIVEVDHDDDPVFRGNLHVGHLDALLEEGAVAFVQVTLPRTLLSRCGGAPVSLKNLRAVRRVLDLRSSRLVLDASRVFENAAWIRRYEPEQRGRNVCDIVRDLAACADLLFLSGRKDVGAWHGGVVAARKGPTFYRLRDATHLLEGDSPWGGISAATTRELAVGIREAAAGGGPIARVEALRGLTRHLVEHGVPAVSCGAGAIYLDAARALPEVPREECPAQTLLNLLYLAAGIRGIGTPAQAHGDDQIVRLSVRTGAKNYLATVLPLILQESRTISAGVRIFEERGPFLAEHVPVDRDAWKTRTPLPDSPVLRPSDIGFGNVAWAQLERSLRRRLRALESWRLLPAARERGPQSMLAEMATRWSPEFTLETDNVLVERLFAFWSRRSSRGPLGKPHRFSVVRASDLAGLDPKVAGFVAVDLGPLGTWPACPGDLGGADVLWASDPAGPGAPGGFLAFRENSPLYQSVRDDMLFFAGSIHDGGVSAADMANLAAALDF